MDNNKIELKSDKSQNSNAVTVSKEVSDRISVLRFPLIMGIVMLHTVLIYKHINFAGTIILILTSGLIPAFTFISSYLFFYKPISYLKILKKKTKSLMIPYTIFPVLICLFFRRNILRDVFSSNILINAREVLQFFTVYDKITFFPAVGHFWFIRNIMISFLISPVIKFLINKFPLHLIFIMTFLYLVKIPIISEGLDYVTIKFFFFFIAGAVCGYYHIDFFAFINKFGIVFLTLLLITLSCCCIVFKIFEYNTFYIRFLTIVSCITFFQFSNLLVKNSFILNLFKYLSGYSFFVYVTHVDILLFIISKTRQIVIQTESFGNVFIIISYTVFVSAFCAVSGIIFKKLLPKVFAILNGNR